MELTELLQIAAEPQLIASAGQAHQILAQLNTAISHLRLEVSELELKADLKLNEILKTNIGVERGKSDWKISEIYKEWKTKSGLLADVRAVRRTLDRHAELLSSQERFGTYKRVIN